MRLALGAIGEGLVELGCDEGALDAGLSLGFGGDAANTAVMAARSGVPARFCGRVGGDLLGARLLTFWTQAGVDTAAVTVDPTGPTGLYLNARRGDGDHRFDYHRTGSAGSRLRPEDVTEAFLRDLAVLHHTGVTLAISSTAAAAARAAATRARALGARISFAINHRSALSPRTDLLLGEARAADVVFLSEEDARAVFASDDERVILRALDGVAEVVLSRGPDGAAVFWAGGVARIAAPAVEVADAAGAGDALAGGYLAARIQQVAPPIALRRAVSAASLSCRAHGCARAYPDSDSVIALARALG